MLVAIFFFLTKCEWIKLGNVFIACVQTPLALFEGRGRPYTGYDFIGEKDQNDRNAIEHFTPSVESKHL